MNGEILVNYIAQHDKIIKKSTKSQEQQQQQLTNL